jgi:hypothetical protein
VARRSSSWEKSALSRTYPSWAIKQFLLFRSMVCRMFWVFVANWVRRKKDGP